MSSPENEEVRPTTTVSLVQHIKYSFSLFGAQRVDVAVNPPLKGDPWYKRPLGLIIVGVITGVIVTVIGAYVLRALLLK